MSEDFIVNFPSQHSVVENGQGANEWEPESGFRFELLSKQMAATLKKFSIDPIGSHQKWTREVSRVSSRCVNPSAEKIGEPQKTVQLVVGRVQSGKTSNFTGVISQLADNGYPIFIVVAGTSIPLRNQTVERLRKDLGHKNYEFLVTGESLKKDNLQNAAAVLKQTLFDSVDPSFKDLMEPIRPLCIVTLKSTTGHLDLVGELFRKTNSDLQSRDILKRSPVAIIDDECDTATPDGNISNSEERTKINKAIVKMRELLPIHSYLGYTATPQAQILMELNDILKPNRVTVLDPGKDYMGIEELFTDDSTFAKEVEQWDEGEVLPDSLREAIAVFLAQNYLFHHKDRAVREQYLLPPLLDSAVDKPISMLIHIDRLVRSSKSVFDAINTLKADWLSALAKRRSHDGHLESTTTYLLERWIFPAFEELGHPVVEATDKFLMSLRLALRDTEVRLIQGGGAAEPFPSESEQETRPAWIFVGAQLLDRGQSLPYLVCSYLGRSSGGGAKNSEAGGNVDTLLQRARFFGYRRQYESLIRGYFSPSSMSSFKAIAVREPIWREALRNVDTQKLDLSKLPYFLEMDPDNPKLKPVRSNVIPKTAKKVSFNSWIRRQAVVSPRTSTANEKVIAWAWDKGLFDSASFEKGNLRSTISLAHGLELLEKWSFHDAEKGIKEALGLALSRSSAEIGTEEIAVFLMHREKHNLQSCEPGNVYRTVTRKTSWDDAYSVDLLSGPDQKLVDPTIPTIQVHFQRILSDEDVTLVQQSVEMAVHIPTKLTGFQMGGGLK